MLGQRGDAITQGVGRNSTARLEMLFFKALNETYSSKQSKRK